MNILLLEDDHSLNRAITKVLTIEKHNVTSAHSGKELLDIIDTPFDIYILDINVPHIDGLTLLEKLQKIFHAQVIIISANSDNYSIQRAMRLGARFYLTKPFHLTELREAITQIKSD